MVKYNPYKVLIITCWCTLLTCCVLQIFGVNWFLASTDFEVFINICIWIDGVPCVKAICMCITSLVLNTLVILAMLKQKFYTKCQIFIFIPLIIAGSICSWFSPVLQYILNFTYYLLPIAFKPKRWYHVLIGIGLVFAFQAVSLFVKTIGGITITSDTPTVIALLLQIDTIIMCALYYLYTTRERRC